MKPIEFDEWGNPKVETVTDKRNKVLATVRTARKLHRVAEYVRLQSHIVAGAHEFAENVRSQAAELRSELAEIPITDLLDALLLG